MRWPHCLRQPSQSLQPCAMAVGVRAAHSPVSCKARPCIQSRTASWNFSTTSSLASLPTARSEANVPSKGIACMHECMHVCVSPAYCVFCGADSLCRLPRRAARAVQRARVCRCPRVQTGTAAVSHPRVCRHAYSCAPVCIYGYRVRFALAWLAQHVYVSRRVALWQRNGRPPALPRLRGLIGRVW